MSCDSGLGSSEESQTVTQEVSTGEDGDNSQNSRTATQSEGHVSSPQAIDCSAHDTPVEGDSGSSQSEQVSRVF